MKMKSGVQTVAVLILAIGANWTPAIHAKGFPQAQQRGDTQLRTFSGTVWMNGSKFVLRDESHRIWYQLDDQKSAAKFEGKEVKVTGTLDGSTSAIHVQDIEEDPVQSQ